MSRPLTFYIITYHKKNEACLIGYWRMVLWRSSVRVHVDSWSRWCLVEEHTGTHSIRLSSHSRSMSCWDQNGKTRKTILARAAITKKGKVKECV